MTDAMSTMERGCGLDACLLARAPIAIVHVDRDRRVKFLNEAASALLNRPAASVLGMAADDVIDPQSGPFTALQESIATGERRELVTPYVPSGGGPESHFLSIFLPDIEADRVEGVTWIGLDVSKSLGEQIAAEVDESQRLLRAVLDNTQAAIYVKDTDSRFLLTNPASARLLGTTPESTVGERDEAFLPRELAEEIYAHDREVVRTGKRQEFEERIEVAGELHTFVSVKFPIRDASDRVVALGGISSDITDRKRDEQALAKRERLSAALSEISSRLNASLEDDTGEPMQAALDDTIGVLSAPVGSIVLREESEWVLNCEHGYGQEVLGRHISDADTPIRVRAAQTRRPLFIEDLRDSDGLEADPLAEEHHLVAMSAIPIILGGRVEGILGVHYTEPHVFDDAEKDFLTAAASALSLAMGNRSLHSAEVEARKAAQNALEQSEANAGEAEARAVLLDSVIASMTDGVVIYAKDGTITRMNDTAKRIFGFGESDQRASVADRWARFQVTDERGRVVMPGQLPLVRSLAGESVKDYVVRVAAPDRPPFWLSATGAPIAKGTETAGAVVVYRDVTAQREMQARQESLVDELGAANRELAAISQVTDIAITTLELEELLGSLLRRLTDVMRADSATVLLAEDSQLRARASVGISLGNHSGFDVRIGEGFSGWIAEHRRPRYVADAQENPLVTDPNTRDSGIRTMLGVPLEVGEALIGVLHVDWLRVHEQDPRELTLLQVAADRVALAIKNAQFLEERREAQRLSGALNEIDVEINSSLEADEILRRVIERSARSVGAHAAVVLLAERGGWRARFGWQLPKELLDRWYGRDEVVAQALDESSAASVRIESHLKGRESHGRFLAARVGATDALNVVLPIGDGGEARMVLYHTDSRAQFTSLQADFMRNVAASVLLALRNARLLADERLVADTLQRALLQTPAHIPGVAFECLYRSATETASVGGDFYDLFELHGDRVGILIGDVSGKGLEASTLTSLVRNTVRAYAYDLDSPASVAAKTNLVVFDSVPTDMFMTLIFGVLETRTGKFTYCNAGHPPGFIVRAGRRIDELTPTAPLIGALRDLPFDEAVTRLGSDDQLFLYTDGVIEARGRDGLFGDERLRTLVSGMSAAGPSLTLLDDVWAAVEGYTGGTVTDDVAMVTVMPSPRQ